MNFYSSNYKVEELTPKNRGIESYRDISGPASNSKEINNFKKMKATPLWEKFKVEQRQMDMNIAK